MNTLQLIHHYLNNQNIPNTIKTNHTLCPTGILTIQHKQQQNTNIFQDKNHQIHIQTWGPHPSNLNLFQDTTHDPANPNFFQQILERIQNQHQ